MKRPLYMGQEFLAQVLGPDDIAVDATMGQGGDTLFLAQHAGLVHAFDIQEQALIWTRERLSQAGYDHVELHHRGHEHVDDYVTHCKAAIFNLGYLPRTDKTVITQAATTLIAIEKLLVLLEVGGRMSIMIYHGHEGGADERDAVLGFVSKLDQTAYTVMLYRPLNQVNHPPFLIMIEKKKALYELKRSKKSN